jgi:hypothetical protein
VVANFKETQLAGIRPGLRATVRVDTFTDRVFTGRVESISAVAVASGAGTPPPSAMRRLGIKMNDGTLQYVDSEVPNVAVGDRVELTPDGYIRPI